MKKSKFFQLLFIPVLILLYTCEDVDTTPPIILDLNEYNLNDNVIILDSLTTPEPIIDGDQYTFNYTSTPPDFKVGDIIIGYSNDGYLMKITGIQKPRESNSLIVILILTRIFLDEVFKDCNFDIPIQIISNNKPLDNIILYNQKHNGVDLDVLIKEGYISTDFELNFKLIRVNGETLEFSLVATGDVDFEAETYFNVSAQIDDFGNETLIFPPLPYPFSIGPVPALIKLGFYGGFAVNISAKGELSYKCLANGDIEFGAEYTNTEKWNGIWEKDGKFTNEGVDWEFDIDANVEVYIKTELSLLVCGFAGPLMNFQPYLNFEANVNTPQWSWELNGGYRGNLGFEVNALGFLKIIDFSIPLAQWETQIDSDEGQIERYSLTISTTGSGNVTKLPDRAYYDVGETVELTAMPSSGWSFSEWQGDLTSSANPKSITMDNNKVVTAVFTENTYTTFKKTFDASDRDIAYGVIETGDGGYVLAGYRRQGGRQGGWIIKTDPNGIVEWEYTDINNSFREIRQTSDGGYIAIGTNDDAPWIVKLNSYGSFEWQKTFPQNYESYGHGIYATNDGGGILVGNIWIDNYFDVIVIKFNSSGNKQWDLIFGGSDHQHGRAIQQTYDGGYIITGDTQGNRWLNDFDCLVAKLSANGNLQWSKQYHNGNAESGNDICITNSGDYIITGRSGLVDETSSDLYLLKINSNGSVLWSKTFNGSNEDWGEGVQSTNDGGIVIVGTTGRHYQPSFRDTDIWLIKTDSEGNIEWTKKFNGGSADWGYSIQQTTDNGYILTGGTYVPPLPPSDYFIDIILIKTDPNGNI